MKKIIGLIALLTVCNACDDGDITIETLDIIGATTAKCAENNVLYQIKDNKSIILELTNAKFATFFENKETIKTDFVAGTLLYRIYDGTVASTNICGAVRPSTPTVTQEWTAPSATLQVTTTPVRSAIEDSGFSKILSFKHAMVLQNVAWLKPDGTSQQESERPFGNYTTPANTLPFGFDETDLKRTDCANNSVYIVSGSEAILIKLDQPTFDNLFPAVSVVGTKTANLSLTNKVTYTLFTSLVTNDYFCASPLPSSPTVVEAWVSEALATNIGKIKVVTESQGSGTFKYTVTLENVKLYNNDNELRLGIAYPMGNFLKNL